MKSTVGPTHGWRVRAFMTLTPVGSPACDAVVVGSSGGLGGALVDALLVQESFVAVHAWSRCGQARDGAEAGRIDLTDEASIAAAFQALDRPLGLVVVASGLLHGEGVGPERSLSALDAEALAKSFAVNAIGPALVAKHALPRLARDRRSVFVALSARVGSIADNRLGGWYGYRASKAALNMMLRSAAIELARTHPLAVCVALHPGTVDTALSRPFQRNVPEAQLFTAEHAAARLLSAIDGLTPADSGGFFAYDGSRVAF